MTNITIACTSIKETREVDTKKDDFGFDTKKEAKKFWIVKFEVTLGARNIKPMMGYETETEARRFAEGRVYSALEWLQLAFD